MLIFYECFVYSTAESSRFIAGKEKENYCKICHRRKIAVISAIQRYSGELEDRGKTRGGRSCGDQTTSDIRKPGRQRLVTSHYDEFP